MFRKSCRWKFALWMCGAIIPAGFAGAEEQGVWVGNESLIPVADGQARKVAPLREPGYLQVEAESADAEILLQNNLEFRGRAFLKIRDTRLVRVTVKTPGKGTVDGFIELTEREVVKFKVGFQKPAGAKVGRLVGVGWYIGNNGRADSGGRLDHRRPYRLDRRDGTGAARHDAVATSGRSGLESRAIRRLRRRRGRIEQARRAAGL